MVESIGNLGGPSSTVSTTGSAVVTDLTITGVITFDGFNATGTSSALLGANAPALSDPTNPQTWIRVVDASGNICVFPVWKLS